MRFYRRTRSIPTEDTPPSFGELSVTVTAAFGALPLLDASVTISRQSVLLNHFVTNQSGLTPSVTVATPPMEFSTEPTTEKPYSEISVRISMPGYYSVYRSGIQVYAGQTSYMQVNLMPLPANEKASNQEIITDTPPHQLHSEMGGVAVGS